MSLDVGSRAGDYEIVAVLGAGGMGKVYRVRNLISDRMEAMKVLLPDLEHEPELADRFMREIKVQASLQHPNIAALHTALRVDNQLLMFMELVEGVTLDQRLRQGPIPVHQGVEYVGQVLDALGYAHQHGVIHRDIKPANMMVTAAGAVKLMDFGIAKAAADRRLTMTGTTMGSLYYMSPEQIQGLPTVDARSDLYSVGVSLYEIVTGKKPFDGDSQFAVMAAHLEKAPVPPVTIDASLPQMLNDVILMSIAKNPEQRFQSAQAFRAALDSVRASLGMAAAPIAASAAPVAATGVPTVSLPLAGAQAPAPPPPAVNMQPAAAIANAGQEQSKPSKRWLWVSVGAFATVLVLIGAIQFGPWRKSSAAPPPPVTDQTQAPPSNVPPASTPRSTDKPAAAAPQATPVEPQRAASEPAAVPDSAKTAGQQKSVTRRAARGDAAKPAVANTGQAASASSAPAPAATPQTPAPPAGDSGALDELRDQLVKLASRVEAVRTSLGNLKRAQAASGMSLRGDMASAETRMNYALEGANSALNAHDAPAAKKLLASAEHEVETLEKFLGL